jgi:alpha-mannosidase
MDQYPEYRFACSQAQQYAWIKQDYPRLYERIRDKVKAGQFEPVGSMWVEADCNVPSGESLVRQIVFGKRFFIDEFGHETTDMWIPDVFGYSAAFPQILREAGISSFLTQKMSWNEINRFPHHTFWWEGIDGSRVFTHFPPTDTYSGEMSVGELLSGVHRFAEHGRSDRSLYPFGYGDGGGGPTRSMLEAARRLADLEGAPRVQLDTVASFFQKAEAEAHDLPVWVHDQRRDQARQSPQRTGAASRRALVGCCRAGGRAGGRDRGRRRPAGRLGPLPGRRARRSMEAPVAPPVPRHHPRVLDPLGLRRQPS